jgi:hypothetical protein
VGITARSIEAIAARGAAAGHWVVVATAEAVSRDETSLDRRLNLVGALHEVGALRNRLTPLWKVWRSDPGPWSARALERLVAGDHDYWAVASLLGLDIRDVRAQFEPTGFRVQAVRTAAAGGGSLHVASLCAGGWDSQLWTGVVELGWTARSGEIVDVARWRAVHFRELSRSDDNATGTGSGMQFLRAALPHGSWRAVTAPFDLPAASAIARARTLLR